MFSWVLTTYFGRRTIYLWGSAVNFALLIILGIAASVGKSNAASLAQASLGLIVSVFFCVAAAPASVSAPCSALQRSAPTNNRIVGLHW